MKIVAQKIIYSQLLESPCFDEDNRSLYFIDISNSLIFRWNLETNELISVETSGNVGALVLDKNNSAIISAENIGVVSYSKDLTQPKLLVGFDLHKKDRRFNDGIIDPNGRYIFGSKGLSQEHPLECALYSFDGDRVSDLLKGLTISNGMSFSPDGRILYHVDTPTGMISWYRYNLEEGKIEYKINSFAFDTEGLPDGITIDKNGKFWIAFWGGAKVSLWDLDKGREIKKINLSLKCVTSCCLSKDEKVLFVTTGNTENNFSIVYQIEI